MPESIDSSSFHSISLPWEPNFATKTYCQKTRAFCLYYYCNAWFWWMNVWLVFVFVQSHCQVDLLYWLCQKYVHQPVKPFIVLFFSFKWFIWTSLWREDNDPSFTFQRNQESSFVSCISLNIRKGLVWSSREPLSVKYFTPFYPPLLEFSIKNLILWKDQWQTSRNESYVTSRECPKCWGDWSQIRIWRARSS